MVAIPDKDRKCREIARLIASGEGVTASCREFGVSEKTFYRWRKDQGAASEPDQRIARKA